VLRIKGGGDRLPQHTEVVRGKTAVELAGVVLEALKWPSWRRPTYPRCGSSSSTDWIRKSRIKRKQDRKNRINKKQDLTKKTGSTKKQDKKK
jgi:hypothetical protein